ncbi:hypothetical protein RI129_002245 [Pyrocoelia pectoralis]|uniref:Pacifastin domain-containing protein n=1 Tax=Pyrocoelia pectoralis TaxID=417401 RepID=A0AAN7VLR3_9COLE
MSSLVVFIVSLYFAFFIQFSKATICAPLSSFKIDCDDCQCSEDGTQYSCQVGVCGLATVERRLSERRLTESPIIRIGPKRNIKN